ncbi:carboxypeptidase-like regulatory domain-containing protein [Sphingobacterium daejeonense]|uniref:Carboxypeptidase-like regulatory domain-containing protein n=1 Tax=Sphingobacterium daejeonense TaxID=371142 RepID=A0ABW3RKU2_9SPHI
MNKNFDIAYLRKYVNGELSSSEMYAIEKASHEDEFLMDVLMGLEEEKKLKKPLDVSDLHTPIFERSHEPKIRSFRSYKFLGIAASLLLVLGIGTIWFLNKDPKQLHETLEAASVEPAEAPTDTTLNSINLDSLDGHSDEETLIAMASPETAPTEELKDSRSSKQTASAASKQGNEVDRIVAQNKDIFLKEVPRADTSGFSDKDELRIASNYAPEQQDLSDNSPVIQIRSKKAPQAKLAGAVSGIQVDRVSSLQDVKKLATGRVLDQQSGRPIANASVRDIKTNDVVMTDANGEYVMPLTSDNQKLEILSLGYEKANIIASNNKIVQLEPSFAQLDEVVVVGYGGKSPKVKSEPLVGWVAYKKYINDNSYQTLLGKGSVTLIFDISTFGRPIDITVKKSSNPELNQKAIQIIQNGPDWKKGNDGKKIEVKISFR